MHPQYFPSSIRVDNRDLHLEITRMTIEQVVPFKVRFQQMQQRSARAAALTKAAADNDDAYKAALDREVAEELDASRFLVETCRDYVRVAPHDPLAIGGIAVTGDQLIEWIGPRFAILGDVATTVYLENTLSDSGKERWKSARASALSSLPRDPAPSGATPETTAAPAPSADSTPSGAATASPGPAGSSGDRLH